MSVRKIKIALILVASVLLAISWQTEAQAQERVASWYGPGLQGNPTASGEPFNMYEYQCAHRFFEFGTRITLGHEGEVATCRVTDRGPFIRGRHVDVAWSVARDLGLLDDGAESVRFLRVAPPY
jgi:peptidoglycan lytic transglycosylase